MNPELVSGDDHPPITDFHHPYTPYDVQMQFMQSVYDVLEKGRGQIGIMESPTGTGKSLSLICSAMTWLRHHKATELEATLAATKAGLSDEPGWIVQQLLDQKREELVRAWTEREERLRKIREREKRVEEQRQAKRRRMVGDGHHAAFSGAHRRSEEEDDEETRFLLDDWEDAAGGDPLAGLSAEARDVLGRMGLGSSKTKLEDESVVHEEIKIFYASRTHSQLSQFISELRRPTFPSSLPTTFSSQDHANEVVKALPLSSRKHLCIHPTISKLKSVQAINDQCTELQQGKKGSQKCAYLPNEQLLPQSHKFRDTALATIPDIEDLHQLGKSLSICPYYASRSAIPGAEIITLPYPLLLQQSAREALGIKLEGNIVIIDEAHNIMDAITGVHSASIKLSDLRKARQMLGVYVKRFGRKLKAENRVMVGSVVRFIDGLSEFLRTTLDQMAEQGTVDPNRLLQSKGIDQINLYKLAEYIQQSKLAYKIESYVSHIEEQQQQRQQQQQDVGFKKDHLNGASDTAKQGVSSTPALQLLTSFLLTLTNLSFEGRIFFQKVESSSNTPDVQLSYLLLSPTEAFSSVASQSRAIILAGGTMSPFQDYVDHLFPTLSSHRITTLSCGHVIPPENLCVWTLAQSRGTPFEFSFQKRGDAKMLQELGLSLVNVCAAVPDGVVIFFPSYQYLDEVVKTWQSRGGTTDTPTVWERLQAKKPIFLESKTLSSDEVLEQYSAAILGSHAAAASTSTGRGAILLAVIGGKMSEGINFSDRLGRCVVVVGLPYPNLHSPEWKARVEYIEQTVTARLQQPQASQMPSTVEASQEETKETLQSQTPKQDADDEVHNHETVPKSSAQEIARQAKQTARDFYENACMRAVNQSIGRAIRHRLDYAAIVLVDRRYGTPRIQAKLPAWIRGGLHAKSHEQGLPQLMGALHKFFAQKK